MNRLWPGVFGALLVASFLASDAQAASPSEGSDEVANGSGDAADGSGEGADGSGEGAAGDGSGAVAPDPGFEGERLPTSRSVTVPTPAPGRAWTRVTREDMELRLPRSAPDALRYEAGVFVQQTAQSQASPFIRGRTGQQVLLSFDGIRMNNSLYRQGPNQYFFTVDVRTIEVIDVIRGSSSVRYGADAIAGAVDAIPRGPEIDPVRDGVHTGGRVYLDYGSASDEYGGRGELELQLGRRVGVFGGVGARRVGLLESGGPVLSPTTGELPEVPRFEDDNRTQLGTGYDEVTSDARIVVDAGAAGTMTAAAYNYRQTNAPRTDQCPPAFAPFDECLEYDEQFRTLGYVRWDGSVTSRTRIRATAHVQLQHEKREAVRPSSFTLNGGRDDVRTLGVDVDGSTHFALRRPAWSVDLDWGAEALGDRVASTAWLTFTDLEPPVTRVRSRGQYLDGSTYVQAAAWTEATAALGPRWTLRGGTRLTHVRASAPGDEDSESSAIDAVWTTPVAGAGASIEVTPWLELVLSADQGFRAPNLDDLTSRQRAGPGFQLENPALRPERSFTLEGAARVRHPVVDVDLWAYRMTIADAITRVSRTAADCPAQTGACNSAWSILQLDNADGAAIIRGVEGMLRVRMPQGIGARATLAWARGDEPLPTERGRQPVSRIPPLNGTGTLLWESRFGLTLSANVQWATLQDRLAQQDVADERIPRGGTPGYTVFGAAAHYALEPWLALSVVAENLGDAAWRTHGSSVNGAGRSVVLRLEAGW